MLVTFSFKNFGPFRELNAWDKAKLLQEEQVPKRISIPVRLVFKTKKKPCKCLELDFMKQN